MINNIHTSQNNLKLNARRVETLGRSFRPTMGDSDQLLVPPIKDQSFAQLKSRLEDIIENESGYRSRLNPKIAVALTAANDRQPNNRPNANDAAKTYQSTTRLV